MGRAGFGTYRRSWEPPTYTVDDDGKVIGGYSPTGPNNWGRWGPLDERWAANFITAEHVLHASSLVKRGQVLSLALPIDGTAPQWPARPFRSFETASGGDVVTGSPASAQWPGFVFLDTVFEMGAQSSTQWDGLCHVPWEDTFYNGFWAGNNTAMAGAPVLGMGAVKDKFVGRGVLLDVAGHEGVDHLDPSVSISAAKLDEVCQAQGIEVGTGDIVLVRTGALGQWWTLETADQKAAWFGGWSGIGADTIPWFAEREVVGVAADNCGLEIYPSGDPSQFTPVHKAFLVDLGVEIGELWALDELAEQCAQDGVYEFLLVAPPLNLTHSVGAPLNPIVIR